MTLRKEIDLSKELTQEEREKLMKAASFLLVFDEDCPDLTEEQLKQFKHPSRNKMYLKGKT